jgi:hypothetical protein
VLIIKFSESIEVGTLDANLCNTDFPPPHYADLNALLHRHL